MIESIIPSQVTNQKIDTGEAKASPVPNPERTAGQDQPQPVIDTTSAKIEITDSLLKKPEKAEETGNNVAEKKSLTLKETEKEMKDFVNNLNDKMSEVNSEVKFRIDKRLNKNYISIVEKETKEIIREYPPEEVRNFMVKIGEILNESQNPKEVKHLLINMET